MTQTPRHSVSVAAAIFNSSGDRVLLVKRRDNGKWEPPGGVLELTETLQEGLRREVAEETGGEISIERLTGIYKHLSRGILALVFRCTLLPSTLSPSEEATEVRWWRVEEVDALVEDVYAIRVLDALENQHGSPLLRAHDGRKIV